MNKPKYVIFDVMYRDAANYKSSDVFALNNETRLTEEYINDELHKFFNENENSLVAQYYNLPSFAPINNEFLPSQGDDHSYTEFQSWEFSDSVNSAQIFDGDIKDVLEAMQNPEIVRARQQEAKKEAIVYLINELKALQKPE